MPDLALDLRYLRYAIVVAEHGSFRRAADALNLSQSTVSRRVQLLERRLGVQLFERSRCGARLTFVGERFIRDAAFGAEHLRQAVLDLSLAQKGFSGELRIGVMVSLASGFLADLFTCFRSRYPDVQVKLEEASSQTNAAGVLSGRLDAAFIVGAPRLPGCDARPLWKDRVFLALPTDHVLANCDRVNWQDIRKEAFIVGADGPEREIEDYLIKQLSELGFRPKIVVQRVGRDNLLNMVAQGFGLTLTLYSTLGTSYSGVVFVPVGEDDERVLSSVVWPANLQNPALTKMLELCELLAEQYERSSLGESAIASWCSRTHGLPGSRST